MDFILNGSGHGSAAQRLMDYNFDPNLLRPYRGSDGQSRVTLVQNGQPKSVTMNAPATLRKDEWKQLDEAVIKVAKPRLKLFGDIRSAGLSYTIPNGMGKTMLEYEDQSDIGPAKVSMDGVVVGDSDQPVYELKGLPLPIIHKDFEFSARRIAASRNGNTPLDTTTAELAAMVVSEEVERMTAGTADVFTFGGASIYGLTNFPSRATDTFTTPTGVATNPTTLSEVLGLIGMLKDLHHYGPYMLYHSSAWDQFMDDDYKENTGLTLRQRLRAIESISDVRSADYLTGFDLVLVQMTSNVIRAVIGFDIVVVQWEEMGGMKIKFKVMAIMVPQLRADSEDNTGIAHATT